MVVASTVLPGNSLRCFLLGSHRLSFTAADYHRCQHLLPTSNKNAHDEHLCAATTEGNSPLENNSIKGRCAKCSESNAVARYSAELDAPCLLSSCPYISMVGVQKKSHLPSVQWNGQYRAVSVPFPFNFCAVAVLVRFQTVAVLS